MHARGRQGGWSLLIVLVALAIVAYLARDSLLQAFGMLSRAPTVGNARLPAGVQPASDATQASPVLAAPVERAHAVEDVVRRQAEQLGKRIDASR
jgi:type II secretory pathway component PulJ